RDAGQDERGDLDVVAEQLTLGDREILPEGLGEVRDLDAIAAGELDDAVLLRGFERVELIEDRVEVIPRVGFIPPEGGSYRFCSFRLQAELRGSRDFARRLVVPQPQIHRMAQLAVRRPFRELDLRDA